MTKKKTCASWPRPNPSKTKTRLIIRGGDFNIVFFRKDMNVLQSK